MGDNLLIQCDGMKFHKPPATEKRISATTCNGNSCNNKSPVLRIPVEQSSPADPMECVSVIVCVASGGISDLQFHLACCCSCYCGC